MFSIRKTVITPPTINPKLKLLLDWVNYLTDGNNLAFCTQARISKNYIHTSKKTNRVPGHRTLVKVQTAFNLTRDQYLNGPNNKNVVKESNLVPVLIHLPEDVLKKYIK